MKTRILTLFSLLALLLVSTAGLAEIRPSGIRIGRAVSGGGTNVEVDITIPSAYGYESFGGPSTAWLGNYQPFGYQYASDNFSVPMPWAIEWGDSYYIGQAPLFGPPGGPYTGTFSHTYLTPGTYVIRAGDTVWDYLAATPNVTTGNVITGHTFYLCNGGCDTEHEDSDLLALAITANATITTGTGIPALDRYGLFALALILVGTGILLFRRPPRAAV